MVPLRLPFSGYQYWAGEPPKKGVDDLGRPVSEIDSTWVSRVNDAVEWDSEMFEKTAKDHCTCVGVPENLVCVDEIHEMMVWKGSVTVSQSVVPNYEIPELPGIQKPARFGGHRVGPVRHGCKRIDRFDGVSFDAALTLLARRY